jgi:flagellar L-ring protein precursor FlgH
MKLKWAKVVGMVLLLAFSAEPKNGSPGQSGTLQQYLDRVGAQPANPATSSGSLFPLGGGALTNLAADNKAATLHDIVIIRIVESTLAQASGSVGAQRSYAANSAISGVGGQNVSYLNPLIALSSDNNLKGTGTANSQSQLRTSVAGRVVAVLPNGYLVVEAERQVGFNQQNQTLVLRGVVRPVDIASDNSVPSTAVSDLEIELKGKGVVSDATRQPNVVSRWLMKILGF